MPPAADRLTLQQLEAWLDAARRALPPNYQRSIAKVERDFGVERTQSREAEERERHRTKRAHPLRSHPPLADFLRSWMAQVPDTNGVTVGCWFDWLLDAYSIARHDPHGLDQRWARQAEVLQRAANSCVCPEQVLYRGEAWPADDIPRRFPIGGSYRVPMLTSVTPCLDLANFYAVSKSLDACQWTGDVRAPVVLEFRDHRGVTAVAIPDTCSPDVEERIVPKGAVYRVTTSDHDGALVRIALAAT